MLALAVVAGSVTKISMPFAFRIVGMAIRPLMLSNEHTWCTPVAPTRSFGILFLPGTLLLLFLVGMIVSPICLLMVTRLGERAIATNVYGNHAVPRFL